MNKPPTKSRRTMDYPDETVGSRLAADARKRANALSDEQRNNLLEGAKALICGWARTKHVAGAGLF